MKIIFSWYSERDVKLILRLACHIECVDKPWHQRLFFFMCVCVCMCLFEKIWIARHFSEHIFENFNHYFSSVKNPALLKLRFPKKMYWNQPYSWGILSLINGQHWEQLPPFTPKCQNILGKRLVLNTPLKT